MAYKFLENISMPMPTTLELLDGVCRGCALPDVSHMNHGHMRYISYIHDPSIVIQRSKKGNEKYGRFIKSPSHEGVTVFQALSSDEFRLLMKKKKERDKERMLRNRRFVAKK